MSEWFNTPNEYHGVKFKSLLESRFARFLDILNLKWEYEPKIFKLNGVWYTPDFYIPEIKLWVETRGYSEFNACLKTANFMDAVEGGKIVGDYLLLDSIGCSFYEDLNLIGTNAAGDAWLGQCRKCGTWYFFGLNGCYKCRKCGYWDGDGVMKNSGPVYFSKTSVFCDSVPKEILKRLNDDS